MKSNKPMIVVGASLLILAGTWFHTRALAAAEASQSPKASAGPRPASTELPLPAHVKITWSDGSESEADIKGHVVLGGVNLWRIKSEENPTELINPAQIRSIAW